MAESPAPSNKQQTEQEPSIDETIDKLNTDPEQGLSADEASNRLEEYGPNAVEQDKRSPLMKLLSHFWGPIPWMLEVAVVLSAIGTKWEEFAVILVMLLINGGVGFWHEHKAENAVEALKERLAPQAKVIRDGERRTIEARKLVPGDIVILRMGDVIPADTRVLEGQISIDESALTGESLPVDKGKGEETYSGTSVKRGEAKAVVTATGRQTKFARTVELVEAAQEKSHFQKAVLRIGYFLIGVTAALVLIMVLIELLLRGQPWMEVLLFALVLTIAGIPQALPAVLTVTMTVGAKRLARMKAIVSKLSSMEEMAGLEVLCADKTGTLTKNELQLQDPVVLEAENKEDLIVAAALTCKEGEGDPIDDAVLEAVDDEVKKELERYEIADFRPFNPTDKRAEADVKKNGSSYTVAKGAPQVILDLVEADKQRRREITDQVNELGQNGYRALGVARKSEERGWVYFGLLPLLDPPREDSKAVIKEAQDHQIDVRMVTGDHAAIAKQVAGQIGLGQHIPEAHEVFGKHGEKTASEEEAGSSEKIGAETLKSDGFAQVTPEHKFAIIKSFQAQDRIVGMTGDGVNDAPALKQADVGIAVAGATDAARAAAHLVLTEPGLGVITHAVEEARRIFERMTGYSTFRIAETMRVLLFVTLSILAFQFYPVTPIMVVLLAILNDIPIMTIANDNVPTAGHPVRWDMKRVLSVASALSVSGVISTFALFWYAQTHMGLSTGQVQTMIFLKLLVAGHTTIFVTRTPGWFFKRPYPNWLLFVALEGTQVIGTLFAVYGVLIPEIGWANAGIVWAWALIWLPINNAAGLGAAKLARRL